ncbi:hypothetical protein [Nocardioides sp. R-C-SC26]|uniref:hypothetical protein n=1 Tax=Nocardioides sp. R-C-SC26 TaxID=2870414 RepID=UPI001E420F67|nr:hypothetical protein [Nocardioides sp. R-C-SC26]
MSTGVRVLAFVAILAVIFGGAWAVGAAVGPIGTDDTGHGSHSTGRTVLDPVEGGAEHEHGSDSDSDSGDVGGPGGLAVAQDGVRLVLADQTLRAGTRPLSFVVEGADGRPVTEYDIVHEKRLHLIAVRRDFGGFQHLHPVLDDGIWSTSVDVSPGAWRVFADFTPAGGSPVTLGADLQVPGSVPPARPGEESRTDEVDGFTVRLHGDLVAGQHEMLHVEVQRDGVPVTPEPYLGALGHLVALREGDLAYLHVHPDGESTTFGTEAPSLGRYHLYFDFRVGGVVRTANFVLDAARGAAASDVDSGDVDAETDETGAGHAH